jgi:hypothetical protein
MYSTRYSCPNLTKSEVSRQFFEKYSNIKCNEKGSSGNRIVPYGQTDMTKLIVVFFRKFSNAPTKCRSRSGDLQASQQSKSSHNTASRSGDRVT